MRMTVVLFFLASLVGVPAALAALPPQFADCMIENSSTNMSITDLQEIARVSKITYCQNQVSIIGKPETLTLLASPNVQLGISVSKTTYTAADFVEMGNVRSYVLYVDGSRLSRADLISISQANVQLVIMSNSGLSKADLLAISAAKPFILNVNSLLLRSDLRDYLSAGNQLVIRTGLSGISRADIVDVATANSAMVTVLP